MGLFDKLLEEANKVVKEVATEENKEKAQEFLNVLGKKLNDAAGEIKNTLEDLKEETQSSSSASADLYEPDGDDRDVKDKIMDVLYEDFSQYRVRCDVSPAEFGGTGRFMNYSIAVFDEETPKLLIMLIGKTTTSHREYRWSREVAEAKGIPFINFIRHYPNRIDYIRQRLHKYL
ncbi:MAG: hypothetical protein K6A40_02135 [Solobacterium sp.]|nr:hypothetical protein [Solobacterium sp.]